MRIIIAFVLGCILASTVGASEPQWIDPQKDYIKKRDAEAYKRQQFAEDARRAGLKPHVYSRQYYEYHGMTTPESRTQTTQTYVAPSRPVYTPPAHNIHQQYWQFKRPRAYQRSLQGHRYQPNIRYRGVYGPYGPVYFYGW